MDRRTILAIMLCLTLFYVWSFATGAGQLPTETDTDASEDAVVDAQQPHAEPPETSVIPAATPPTGSDPNPMDATDESIEVKEIPFAACDAKGILTTDGGFLRSVTLDNYLQAYDMQPLYSWLWGKVSGGSSGGWLPYGEAPSNQMVATDSAQFLGMGSGEFESRSPRVRMVENSANRLVFRGTTRDGIEVTRTLTEDRSQEPCVVQVEVSWKNVSSTPFSGNLWLAAQDHVSASGTGYYTQAALPVWMTDRDSNSWSAPATSGWFQGALEKPEPQDGAVDYFGISNGYFSIVLVTPGDDPNMGSLVVAPRSVQIGTVEEEEDLTELAYGSYYTVRQELKSGESVQRSFQLYTGANKPAVLKSLDPKLTYLVDFGWFALIGWPLFWGLTWIYGVIGNWGFAIILLTFTMKMMFFPLTQKAFKSSQRMQAISPQLKSVREEFKDNPEELNRRTMALFRENKVNPLGGCLPMIIQMPIWIALYRVLLNSVDLFHTEWFYLRDLSSTDPYCILPVIVVALMLIQQQFMPTGNMDPKQARMMKLMPLIFGFFFFTFPSGLVLYIFVNMCLTIVQQWIIKRSFGKTAPVQPAAAA